jgi:hypothetical protein
MSESSPPPLVVAVDAALPPAVVEACQDLAAALADAAGTPVALAPLSAARLEALGREVAAAPGHQLVPPRPAPSAAPMGAAPFVWRADGRPDWGAMWTAFCDLALHGGPPHRGEDSALRAPENTGAGLDPALMAELRRGIWETTGLYAEPGPPGWLAVTCTSRTMAAWLAAVIILENVDARSDEERLLVPVGPDYQLADQVKSLVTVVAKTAHYWQAHVTR